MFENCPESNASRDDVRHANIVDAMAEALCEAQNPGDSWEDFDGSDYQAWLKDCVTAELNAALPLIRKAFAEKVRDGLAAAGDGGRVGLQGHSKSSAATLGYQRAAAIAARLIEEAEL